MHFKWVTSSRGPTTGNCSQHFYHWGNKSSTPKGKSGQNISICSCPSSRALEYIFKHKFHEQTLWIPLDFFSWEKLECKRLMVLTTAPQIFNRKGELIWPWNYNWRSLNPFFTLHFTLPSPSASTSAYVAAWPRSSWLKSLSCWSLCFS